MPLKIIGAGLGRTGTHSLKLALEELGFGKCYHMEDLIALHPENVSYWKDVQQGKPVNWEKLFEGYQSAVDFPVHRYYKKLMKAYPDAKVILTIRDAEGWYKSFGDTIIRQTKPSPGRIFSMMLRLPFSKTWRNRLQVFKYAGGHLKEFYVNGFEDKTATLKIFNDWNQSVKNFVPQEKLLVYDVKEGWEPLCRFLGVAVPSKPFPHSNTTQEFNSRKF